ncbi:MAG: formylglycine-generating enzyme family protein, partial [Planctomycetota bacterium]
FLTLLAGLLLLPLVPTWAFGAHRTLSAAAKAVALLLQGVAWFAVTCAALSAGVLSGGIHVPGAILLLVFPTLGFVVAAALLGRLAIHEARPSDPGGGGTQVNAKRRRRLRPLLIPVVILVVLGIAYAALDRARERYRRRWCRGCLNNCINYACHLFAQDHGGHYPPTLGVLYPDFASDGKVFLCPSAGRATALEDDPHFSRDGRGNYTPALSDGHTDYVYVSGLKASDPGHYVLAFDDEWNHDGDGVHVLCVALRAPRDSDWWPDIKALHEQLARQEKELAAQGRKMKVLRPAWSSWPDPPGEARPISEAQREERRRELKAELRGWFAERAAERADEGRAARERRRRHVEDVARLAAEDRSHMKQALLALSRDLPPTLTLDLGRGVTMGLVLIPAGEFLMGDPRWNGRLQDFTNGPVHRVRITRPFYMGKCEVTQAQYEPIMGENPSRTKGANYPVERMSWFGATEFCRKLSELTGKTVRLPTEAEWEYACRAGTTTYYFFGDGRDDGEGLSTYTWHGKNSRGRYHPVGGKRANAWGLHDMYGNVWEWCSDWYDPGYYARSPEEDPQGPEHMPTHWSWGGSRVLRGEYGSASRYHCFPALREFGGFRVVAAAPGQ